MRNLDEFELKTVSGGEGSSTETVEEGCSAKNNNGYGNGPESGPPPGNSGAHNPQLTGWNEGPRGAR